MPRFTFRIDSKLPPERIIGALTDFSDRRPEIWPELDRSEYEVYEVGDGWAEVREGTARRKVWARERYEWSPDRVRWTVLESDVFAPGSYVEARVEPRPGGGTSVHIIWERHGADAKNRVLLALLALMRGAPVRRVFANSLREVEARLAG